MLPGLLYATIRCADDRCVQLTVRENICPDICADEIDRALAIIADAVETARADSMTFPEGQLGRNRWRRTRVLACTSIDCQSKDRDAAPGHSGQFCNC
jgi:hypothetical protein